MTKTKAPSVPLRTRGDAFWNNQIGEPKVSTRVMPARGGKKKIKKPKRPKGY